MEATRNHLLRDTPAAAQAPARNTVRAPSLGETPAHFFGQEKEEPQCPSEPLPPPRGGVESALRRFVEANQQVSTRISRWAARHGQTHGFCAYMSYLEELLRPGLTVIDLGGGKHPSLTLAQKRRLGLYIIGVDITQSELDAAPPGVYDEAICQSAERFMRPGAADLIITRALAEHVEEPVAMFRCVYESLRPGGETLHFIPNRYALFAWLNRLLPQEFKRTLLHTLYPATRTCMGFPALYRDCSPARVEACFRALGFRDIKVMRHYFSNYFAALFPLHAAMTGWQLAAQHLGAGELCENFVVHAHK